ncbi:MAG: SRPBCC domain-containing protein [Betaproteobacteria bacterium]|nr:SRPBCC domain-containing protein [Betaproteobacteria bacterium]
MSSTKRIQFTATINAPVPTVWRLMIGLEGYKRWASAFAEGCYFEGAWEQGAKIKFLSPPSGDGMVSEIAQNRNHEFISIRHLGFITNGVEDTTSESIRAWAPAYENYTFISVPDGTKLVIDMDVAPDWEQHMNEAWPKALVLLKQLSESGGAA